MRTFGEAEAELDGLALRAQRGDTTVLPALRQKLRENTDLIDQLGGDIALRTEYTLVRRTIDVIGNLGTREAILAKLESLRAELSGPDPTPLERLLVARIVASWLQTNLYEANHAQKRNLTLEEDDHLQRRINHAHKRLLSAIRSLALVRKLLTPPRSPVEIATCLGGARAGANRPQVPVESGTPVLN
jgi:hypothetical protein